MFIFKKNLIESSLFYQEMKIKTTAYQFITNTKRDKRLCIGIDIELPDGAILNTGAIVQLHPIAYFADKVPEETFGMLFLSAIVYAIDRSVKRDKYSIDGWSREFDADILIPQSAIFQQNKEKIDSLLSFLTGDYWKCNFVEVATIRYPKYKACSYFEGITQVNLFSGGLDSLIGAIDYMAINPSGRLFLSSHYDSDMNGPNSDQEKLKAHFAHEYPNNYIQLPAILVKPRLSVETSCRSRSFMFISLALIVAVYSNCNIIIPENGSVSLNFPLSASRRASCSTRTTHPVFIRSFQELLRLFGFSTRLINPYEKQTKGEMVANCANKNFLLRIVADSNSCGKRGMHQFFYDNHYATHCGHCMPCMYRKASLIGENDKTTYGNKFSTLFFKKGDKVAEDFYSMLDFLKKDYTRNQIIRELNIAGMSSFSDIDDYIDLVFRTRTELSNMLKADKNPVIDNYMGW